MKKDIVHARGRHGTTSMDLTLLTKIIKKYNIKDGDFFEVTVDDKDGLKIIYKLIHNQ